VKRFSQALLVGLLSGGWIVPGYLALQWHWVGMEHLAGYPHSTSSFPFVHESHKMLVISAVYLFVVVVFWAGFAFIHTRKAVADADRA
jgi:hypothetical protein